jgi:hypothetical protein
MRGSLPVHSSGGHTETVADSALRAFKLADTRAGFRYKPKVMRDYTNREIATANLPYAVMILLGAATIAAGFRGTPWAMAGALAYAFSGVGGAIWIMVRVCPYCVYFGTRGCPCGYGTVSARLVKKAERECFSRQFKRHIPVIVPLWLIPPAVGALALAHSFRGWLLALTVVFVLNSYVLLPLLARRHSCGECPQREACPWMAGRRSAKGRQPPVARAARGHSSLAKRLGLE